MFGKEFAIFLPASHRESVQWNETKDEILVNGRVGWVVCEAGLCYRNHQLKLLCHTSSEQFTQMYRLLGCLDKKK